MSGSSRFSRGIVVCFATLGIGLANLGGWAFYFEPRSPEIALLQVSRAH